MITDHTAAAAKLHAIAAGKGTRLPKRIGHDQQAMLDKLAGLKGAEFDKVYVDDMIGAHEKAVALFENASGNCTDADYKSFATATLPTLREHLAKIKAIKKTL